MKKQVFLATIFLFAFFFCTSAIKPKRIFVKGGEMLLKDQTIQVRSFHISKYEITNAEYATFLNDEKVGSNGMFNGLQLINISSNDLQIEYTSKAWKPKLEKENYPMVMVSYFGANEFCRWKGGKLPSETEWIYAAKGGRKSNNYIYAGSNNLDEVGWHKGNSDGHSHPVGQKKPNKLGIYDMSGNAWEWCLNDSLKSDEDFCVHMGGSWFPGEQPSQISSRYGNIPTHFSNSVGFRTVYPVLKRKK